MGLRTEFIKSLTAGVANNLAQSQSASAGVPLTLNGSATNFLSTTTTAAVAVGNVNIPLTSVTGVAVGQTITDTTAVTLVAGTKVTAVGTAGVVIWPPVGGVGVGSGDTIVFPGLGTIDATSATTSGALGRRVAIAYTGTDTSFVIVGTNAGGNIVTDTAVGSAGAAVSNLDFVTVISITPVGGGLTGVTAGTNGVGASPWNVWNTLVKPPLNIGMGVVVSGTVNYTVQHTYDDPNNLDTGLPYATAFSDPVLVNQTATADGLFVGGAIATRVLINSGTGSVRCWFNQIGVG